jgi:hypothetical protein
MPDGIVPASEVDDATSHTLKLRETDSVVEHGKPEDYIKYVPSVNYEERGERSEFDELKIYSVYQIEMTTGAKYGKAYIYCRTIDRDYAYDVARRLKGVVTEAPVIADFR